MAKAKSYYVLLTVNVLALVIALVILGLALNLLYGPGLGVASLDGLPVQIYYVVIAFSLFVFLISLLGVIGGSLHSKVALGIFSLLDLLLALTVVIIMIFVLLYANGKSTTTAVDNSIATLQKTLEAELLTQAVSEQKVWLVTQKGFKCCGIDLESTYAYATYNYTDAAFLQILQSGTTCAAGITEIQTIHANFTTYTTAAQTASNNDPILSTYFCKTAVSDVVKANTIYIGIIAGVLVLLQIVTATAAIRLLTKVYIDQGGFVKPPEDLSADNLAYGGGPKTNSVSNGNTLA